MQVQPGMSSNILGKLLDFWYLSICNLHGTCSNGQSKIL
jgi:hypothetical protein